MAQDTPTPENVWALTNCYYMEEDRGGELLSFFYLLIEDRYSMDGVLYSFFNNYECEYLPDGSNGFAMRYYSPQQSLYFEIHNGGDPTANNPGPTALSNLTIEDEQGVQELSLTESAAVWEALYSIFLQEQGYDTYNSIWRDIQGEWTNDGGKTMLVITQESYDESTYECVNGANGKLLLRIFRESGKVDERYLKVSEDKMELYIYTDPDWSGDSAGLLATYVRAT
ncbi:MAG: hypothetical protein RSF73_09155, partial [Ruthenibacterium sp.]